MLQLKSAYVFDHGTEREEKVSDAAVITREKYEKEQQLMLLININ